MVISDGFPQDGIAIVEPCVGVNDTESFWEMS